MIGFIQILGGLALFLYGIRLLSSGMEKLTGEYIQKWLDRVTSGRIKSFFFGAAATALIQSSGLLMVTMIGLINANLMTVEQAIGVMLGQEIGTTFTAQIVAFEIGNFRLMLVILGILLIEFSPNREWKKYGEIFMGLGIVFVGMSFMSNALDGLIEIPWVASSLLKMGETPLVGVLAGLIFTSLTQSSTAVTSLTVAMGISHCITVEGAVGIILGANIGSCITGFIAAARLSPASRQASLAQISINVIGVLLFLPFITPYSNLVKQTSTELPRQIANAHTIFNVAVSLALFPFVKPIANFASWLAPNHQKEREVKSTAYIDEKQYSVPSVALNEAARELIRLGQITAGMVEDGCRALIDHDTSLAQRVLMHENQYADPITRDLDSFVNTLMQADLSITQQKRCFQVKNLLTDMERVGDMAENIAQYAMERIEKDIRFSPQAMDDLSMLSKNAHENYLLAVRAFEESDRNLANQVCQQEKEFDQQYWKTRQGHIERLKIGVCQPDADVIFTEVLRNLERISDHADNLGISVIRNTLPDKTINLN
jgi:phosphate:Na+ symporter